MGVLHDRAQPWVWDVEASLIDGQAVAELSSARWCPKAQSCVGMGCLRDAVARQVHIDTVLQVDSWVEEYGATAWDAA